MLTKVEKHYVEELKNDLQFNYVTQDSFTQQTNTEEKTISEIQVKIEKIENFFKNIQPLIQSKIDSATKKIHQYIKGNSNSILSSDSTMTSGVSSSFIEKNA